MAEDERKAEGKRAAELLLANGFKVEHDSGWLYNFAEPLSNDEIECAKALFKNGLTSRSSRQRFARSLRAAAELGAVRPLAFYLISAEDQKEEKCLRKL